MTPIEVSFRLQFAVRHDSDAGVFVGYCPSLKLYSQGRTDQEAEDAVVSAAKLFIVACYERDILHSVLRKRGMTKAIGGPAIAKLKASPDREFISVMPALDHEVWREVWREVPISLLAGLEGVQSCLQ